MASKIEIANQALIRLSANPIIGFSDQTIEAKKINAIFELVVDDVISMGPWSSAKTRAILAQDVTAPLFGYTYSYTLPSDCVRLLRINECRVGDIPYALEHKKLLTNEPTMSIVYLKHLKESDHYDAYLRQAIVWQLCYELAYQVMGDKSAANNMVNLATNKIEDLLNLVGSQAGAEYWPSDLYLDIRRAN